MDLLSASLVTARVRHARRAPKRNRFAYGVDYLLLDEAHLAGRCRPSILSCGSGNLVSLHADDYGVAGLKDADGVREFARGSGILGVERVLLLVHPRYWGYTFNPVSFWFLTGHSGNLRCVLAEVHNTYGDRHAYLCSGADGVDLAPDMWIETPKRLHVSPFFDVRGTYRFRFSFNETRIAVTIVYDDGAGGGLFTSLSGHRRPLTTISLARALLVRPFGALRVTWLIHWQALRLFRKGHVYRPRPEPPDGSVT